MSRLSIKYFVVFSLLSAIIFLPFEVTSNGDDSLTAVLNGILKRYGDLPGLAVTYQREIITRSSAILGDEIKKDVATGNFLFKPPYYLKVVQENPGEEIITTDGQIIWWYIPEKMIVYQYPADKLGKELWLLSDIFRGLSDATEVFDVHFEEFPDELVYHLSLIPKEPWEEMDHISLSVDSDDFHILVVEIHNMLGSVTRFRLGDPSIRKDFEKGFFKFVAPEGVKVIEEE